jgi:membrane protein implicated in regulation of membrane protease activity
MVVRIRNIKLTVGKKISYALFQLQLVTIIISMSVAISIGIYGFAMFVLGDSYNTLYIFAILSALAMYIYKPKVEEYQAIVESVAAKSA